MKVALPWIVIAIFVLSYHLLSVSRLSINPNDKLTPSIIDMGQTFWQAATGTYYKNPDEYILWKDTFTSLRLLLSGVISGFVVGAMLGLVTGTLPYARASLRPIIVVLSIVPPLSLLSLMFIIFGSGDSFKIALVMLGVVFLVTRDTDNAASSVAKEQIIKGQTLGAGTLGIMFRVIWPQILPRVMQSMRLTLGIAWLCLIAAEVASANAGLAYRMKISSRFLAMDLIIPYVMWITLIGYILDTSLRLTIKKLFSKWDDAL